METSTEAHDAPEPDAVSLHRLRIRLSMAGRVPRLIASRDPASRAAARALCSTALGLGGRRTSDWIDRIEARRAQLASERTAVSPNFDPAAGGVTGTWFAGIDGPVPIWGIARMFSIPSVWGAFLLRLIRELAPSSCIELGTGLGLSAAYQAAALELNDRGSLVTLEGAEAWAVVAEQGLDELGLAGRARVQRGSIDDLLPPLAAELAPIDYAFLDADHSEEATVKHFEMIEPHLAGGGVVLLDDVNHSEDMRRAWESIGGSRRASGRLELGRMGLVTIG
jgi:predicted O-methyltransferase YrrM